MHDPEFQHPAEKSLTVATVGPAPPPTCKLAVVSLVFGILSYVPLPLVGALIAIVTGHIALSEIRASGGQLGGRSAAKAGLILGYLWFVVALLAVLIVFTAIGFVSVGPQATLVRSSPRPILTPGVKMANQMSQREVENLQKLNLGDRPEDEEIIAYFSQLAPEDGEPEIAVLTNQRVAYLKGERVTSFDLKDIETILEGPKFREKYLPNYFGSNDQYPIEIKRRTGGRMRIQIQPALDGPSFSEALQDAWKTAGGKPEGVQKK